MLLLWMLAIPASGANLMAKVSTFRPGKGPGGPRGDGQDGVLRYSWRCSRLFRSRGGAWVAPRGGDGPAGSCLSAWWRQWVLGKVRHLAGLSPDSARARHRRQRLEGATTHQHARLKKKACPGRALSLGRDGRVFLLPTILNLSCVCLFSAALGTPWRQAKPRKLWNFYDSACG